MKPRLGCSFFKLLFFFVFCFQEGLLQILLSSFRISVVIFKLFFFFFFFFFFCFCYFQGGLFFFLFFFFFFFFLCFFFFCFCYFQGGLLQILLSIFRISMVKCKYIRIARSYHVSDALYYSRLYNFDPLKPHFYTVQMGFTGVYVIFLISAQNIDCGYSLEPPRLF